MYKIASANAQRRVSAILPKHIPAVPMNIPTRDEWDSLKRAVAALEVRLREKDYQSKQEYTELCQRKELLITRIRELKKVLKCNGVSPLDPRAIGRVFTDIARSRLPKYLFDEIMNEAKRQVREAADSLDSAQDPGATK